MDWGFYLSEINWWAVILATLSSFAVGMLWYAKAAFGAKWIKLVGLKESDLKNNDGMAQTFVMTAIAGLIGNAVLNMLMLATATSGAGDGLIFGAIVGF